MLPTIPADFHPVIVNNNLLGGLWFVGWLFTIGYLQLSFWQGVLAIVIWPYYLGVYYHHKGR